MNIALFSDSYIPTKSGIVTVVIQLKKVLEELGHHVVIVTVGANKEGCPDDDPNVFRVTSIPSPVGDGQFVGFPHKKEVIAFLKVHKVQIIHAHTEFFIGHLSNVVGKELGIPVVATTHTMWEDYYRYYLSFVGKITPRRVIRRIVRTLYKKFYAFINVSEKACNYFRRSFMLPYIPSAIIPNAIDSEKFASHACTQNDKEELKRKLGLKETDKVILYVGRVVEEKRLDNLVEIFKNVVKRSTDIKTVIVGSGARLEKLQEDVENEGLQDKVIFTGFVEWEKLSVYYSIATAFVTVSLSEMHSMTILEALSMGVPVVCRYDTSFSDTVFNGENGFALKSDSEVEECILELCRNIELCQELSVNSLKISKNFSLEMHGKKIVAFYKEVLAHFPNPVSSEQLENAVKNC